ncbi:MAG: response regulator transcription factor [Bacteroidetes bacterium]|nr:response regulator transcription factor [Bacteroidota bacterium]MBS1619351.1 response regulator transcription factor [Bacteroidota bacterium]
MISCVVIDDEPVALEVIEEFISRTPALELKGAFSDAYAGAEFLKNNKVQLLFLDIQMPRITGIQLLKSLPEPPLVIFTTAYSNYAVEGFNLNAIDFLLKPIDYDRFLKAVNKAEEYISYREKPAETQVAAPFIFVKSDYQIVKIDVDDITMVEGMDDYVKIFTNKKMTLTNMTMKDILSKLPANKFARVHRSYIISLLHIESVRNKRIKIGDKQIPVGDSFAESFYKMLGENG